MADPATHRFFAARLPEALRCASVGDQDALAKPRVDPELVGPIQGVTIEESLLDAATARWFAERGVRVLVWTVNDLARANELIRPGIDAITTDNLAPLALFGGRRRGESSPDDAPPTTPRAGGRLPPRARPRRRR